ncbi:MAG: amidohydrolase [Syntrophobacterales bacterium]|nr:MAG: amidohydrolase [Syntrophobacterales bacterium]
MTSEKLKEVALDEIDRHSERIVQLGKSIFSEPEEGFREFKTAKKVEEIFSEWGIPFQRGLGVTGVKGSLDTGREGPTIALLGEMDALLNPDHPLAEKETGLVHACGHFAQIAWLIGAGFGIRKVMEGLSGEVVLFAVPAEEFINLEFRQKLKEAGEIEYFGGKQELVRIGALDDVDLVLMNHAQSEIPGRTVFLSSGSNGFIGKAARFLGRAAHAGVAPFKGINAMNAFHVALSAIHAQRETFKDDDMVRVHLIVTKGGDSVNVVPSEVRMEMYVRAKSVEAIEEANAKVDRALKAGAMGVGAGVEITNTPGYLPISNDERLAHLWMDNASTLLGNENVRLLGPFGGSTDMGDLTHLKPGIHPFVGSFTGDLHSKDFRVDDEEMAFLIPAKIMAMATIELLSQEAREAKEIIAQFKPRLSKEEYLRLLDSLTYQTLWREG